MSSKKWLAVATSEWTVKFHLKINIKRDEALGIISMEGMLLILCSFIDNMPYVVAEAAVSLCKTQPLSACFECLVFTVTPDHHLAADSRVLDWTAATLL